MANGTKIFVGPVYTSICEKTKEQIQLFNVFSENEVSLHIFMVAFVKDRECFCYDTYFPHYIMLKAERDEIIGAGGISVSREGEESCIHDWQMKAMDKRFS